MPPTRSKVRPIIAPEYCKGCGRCVDACALGCIEAGHEIHPGTGLVPVTLHLEACSGCALCFDACPEPYALAPEGGQGEPRASGERPLPESVPAEWLELPESGPLVMKGTHASAIGALVAGCRHFFGYPITPSTEGAELMAKLLPKLDGVFLQAVSEVATVNLMYGCGAAGLPSLTFTSSPGFSLMLEGLSYMIGAEVPGVFVDVMRGGPGLGNIAPEQSDIKLACRGLGHGNTHAIVLAPSSPQEMLDLTQLAFELAFEYRTPVIVLADGYLGQVTGKVKLPRAMRKPGLPGWAVWGDASHRRNLISSIYLAETELEAHNLRLIAKYDRIGEPGAARRPLPLRRRRRAAGRLQHPGADGEGRGAGAARAGRAGRPAAAADAVAVPDPPAASARLAPAPADRGRGEPRAARGRAAARAQPCRQTAAGAKHPPIESLRRYGGVLPAESEIIAAVLAAEREPQRELQELPA